VGGSGKSPLPQYGRSCYNDTMHDCLSPKMGDVLLLASNLRRDRMRDEGNLNHKFVLSFPHVRKEPSVQGVSMPLRMRVHDREPIGLALRRFKKLLERSGIQKELRKRKYYEKPCEARRRAELRKQSAIRKAKLGPKKP
jgi:small subunit ribosomal protein S21